jgi:hypothetical protein
MMKYVSFYCEDLTWLIEDIHQVFEEEETDEFADYFANGKPPKVLVTTSKYASGVRLSLLTI